MPGDSGTNGELFLERFGPDGDHKLLPLPDTSSADIILKYQTYPDDPEEDPDYEFSIEYDYNLFDTGSNTLSSENKYQVRVVETVRTSRKRGLSRSEVRKLGADGPVQSIYQPKQDEYIFPRYEFTVDSAPPGDVADFLEEVMEPIAGATVPLVSATIKEDREPLGVEDDVPPEDAYEIEALYRFFGRILNNASNNIAATSNSPTMQNLENTFLARR